MKREIAEESQVHMKKNLAPFFKHIKLNTPLKLHTNSGAKTWQVKMQSAVATTIHVQLPSRSLKRCGMSVNVAQIDVMFIHYIQWRL